MEKIKNIDKYGIRLKWLGSKETLNLCLQKWSFFVHNPYIYFLWFFFFSHFLFFKKNFWQKKIIWGWAYMIVKKLLIPWLNSSLSKSNLYLFLYEFIHFQNILNSNLFFINILFWQYLSYISALISFLIFYQSIFNWYPKLSNIS